MFLMRLTKDLGQFKNGQIVHCYEENEVEQYLDDLEKSGKCTDTRIDWARDHFNDYSKHGAWLFFAERSAIGGIGGASKDFFEKITDGIITEQMLQEIMI